jgi:hypothetical protein
MTLSRCAECNEPVSTRAAMCPHCGCPADPIQSEVFRRHHRRPHGFQWGLLAAAIVAAATLLLVTEPKFMFQPYRPAALASLLVGVAVVAALGWASFRWNDRRGRRLRYMAAGLLLALVTFHWVFALRIDRIVTAMDDGTESEVTVVAPGHVRWVGGLGRLLPQELEPHLRSGAPLLIEATSHGGSLVAGLALADAISQHGQVTMRVIEQCSSACAALFAVAHRREMHYSARIGVHAPHDVITQERISNRTIDRYRALVGSKFSSTVMQAIENIPPGTVMYFDPILHAADIPDDTVLVDLDGTPMSRKDATARYLADALRASDGSGILAELVTLISAGFPAKAEPHFADVVVSIRDANTRAAARSINLLINDTHQDALAMASASVARESLALAREEIEQALVAGEYGTCAGLGARNSIEAMLRVFKSASERGWQPHPPAELEELVVFHGSVGSAALRLAGGREGAGTPRFVCALLAATTARLLELDDAALEQMLGRLSAQH